MKTVSVPGTQRATLKTLLAQEPALLERGLTLVEEEVEIGGARIDLLAGDPARRPVLVFLAGGALEEQDAPLRVLDGDAAFRRHVSVLRRLLPEAALDWELPPRSLVVGEELSRQTLERFEAITSLEVDLVELRSIRIRGEQRWAAIPVSGEAAKRSLLPADAVPESLEDPLARSLWDSVADRIQKLDADLEVRADRHYREFLLDGKPLAVLESCGRSFRVLVPEFPGGEQAPSLVVADENAADQAVDLVIRRYLVTRGLGDKMSAAQAARHGGDPGEVPTLAGVELAMQTARLSDDEIAAFFDPAESSAGGGV